MFSLLFYEEAITIVITSPVATEEYPYSNS